MLAPGLADLLDEYSGSALTERINAVGVDAAFADFVATLDEISAAITGATPDQQTRIVALIDAINTDQLLHEAFGGARVADSECGAGDDDQAVFTAPDGVDDARHRGHCSRRPRHDANV